MTRIEKQQKAAYKAEYIYGWLWSLGLSTYRTPSGNLLLWIPRRHQVIPITDFKAVSHAIVMMGGFEPRVPMRNAIVNRFITFGIQYADDATYAPLEFKDTAKALNLY